MVELEEIGTTLDAPGDIHVYPIGGHTPQHELTAKCWCEPEVDHVAEDGTKVWVHRGVQ